jgi:site-specific DNA-methyltransferase (adenine-specific)
LLRPPDPPTQPQSPTYLGLEPRAPRNRTITLTAAEQQHYQAKLLQLTGPTELATVLNRTLCQDLVVVADWLPRHFVDLLILDPPYNLAKQFGQRRVPRRSVPAYQAWVESWFEKLMPLLKPTATVYICGDWQTSLALYPVAARHLQVRNRITWEREKGRAARQNWKNCAEDIWFCTVGNQYYFDAEAVRVQRQVRAPYTDAQGKPKDWQATEQGNYRQTAASNLWTDLTVPFWSMPENTDHPTQKPEKLIAKLILASAPVTGVVLDPFLGSGTTSVVAAKLGRQYLGIELDPVYACLAEKRLELAQTHPHIQGYADGVFWERNSSPKR